MMKCSGGCFTLAVALGFSTIAVKADSSFDDLADDQNQSSRFSPEAIELLAALSERYEINDRAVPFKPRDYEQLARLVRSGDANIKAAVRLAILRNELHDKKAAEARALRQLRKGDYADEMDKFNKEGLIPLLKQRARQARILKLGTGCDIMLISSMKDVSQLPRQGKNLIIIAAMSKGLHFRIFDSGGSRVVDADEKEFSDKFQEIEDLKDKLTNLWPPHTLSRKEKDWLITAVTSVVDQKLDNNDWGDDVIRLSTAFFVKPVFSHSNADLRATAEGRLCNILLKQATSNLAKPIPAAFEIAKPVGVRLDRTSGRYAFLVLTNTSGRTLHNCLVFSRYFPDLKRLAVAGMNATVFHAGINALLRSPNKPGYPKPVPASPTDVLLDGAEESTRLQFAIESLEDGALIYVADIPPNAKVKIWLCPENRVQFARSVELALWCDELSVNRCVAENFVPREDAGETGFVNAIPSKPQTDKEDDQSFKKLRPGTMIAVRAPTDDNKQQVFRCWKSVHSTYQETDDETITIDFKKHTVLRLRALAMSSEGYIVPRRNETTRRSVLILIPHSQVLHAPK